MLGYEFKYAEMCKKIDQYRALCLIVSWLVVHISWS